MPFSVGDRLGHFSVTAKIGEGGMGEVYRAQARGVFHDFMTSPWYESQFGPLFAFRREAR